MNKNTPIIIIVLAALLLIANIIIVRNGLQMGVTKWGSVLSCVGMVFVIVIMYIIHKRQKGK
ncbi:MAG: hypothetical protein K6C10_12055 [Prevotella sp.]|nr:hypothetical protein [Prevotella sp.]